MKKNAKTLSTEKAQSLFQRGKAAWNEWTAQHQDWSVDFRGVEFENADFSNFKFPGKTIFAACRFKGRTNFKEAHFNGHALFNRAWFEGKAEFDRAVFRKKAEFLGVSFVGDTLFKGAEFNEEAFFQTSEFEKVVYFSRAKFSCRSHAANFHGCIFHRTFALACYFARVPDLVSTHIPLGVDISQIKIDEHSVGHFYKKYEDRSESARYRRLKDLALEAKDIESEQKFFGYELRAKRGYKTTGWKLVPNLLYDWFGDFGRSISRPTFILIAVWLIWAVFYWLSANSQLPGNFFTALVFSASQIVPFFGFANKAGAEAIKALYCNHPDNWVFVLAFVENLFGFSLIFLVGVALRNRFKI